MSDIFSPTAHSRLFFHIGAGKTGTSSIQQTLWHSRAQLQNQGVWYLGMMLERAPLVKYPWQRSNGSEIFHALKAKEAESQLEEILSETVAEARRSGAHTLIWSNESFFGRNKSTRAALQRLIEDGVDVRIVAYVRRHDAWLKSAYAQWGIKHKTYAGPVKPFKEWSQTRQAKFAPPLWSLSTAFPERLMLRNLDGTGDAVADFAQVCGIDASGLTVGRHNVTPSQAELMLRALYNSRYADPVLPERFDRGVASQVQRGGSATEYMAMMMPDDDSLSAARMACEEDRRLVNMLLTSMGQQEIAWDEHTSSPVRVNESELVFKLAQIVMAQAQRIERMEAVMRKAGLLGQRTP